MDSFLKVGKAAETYESTCRGLAAGETRTKQIYCNVVFVLCGPNRPKRLIQKLPGLSVDTLSIHHIDYVIRVDDCLQAKSIVSAKYSHSSPTHMNGNSLIFWSVWNFRKCGRAQPCMNLYTDVQYTSKTGQLVCGSEHNPKHISPYQNVQHYTIIGVCYHSIKFNTLSVYTSLSSRA